MLVESLSAPSPRFHGRADAEGLVEPPLGTAGILLVRHPSTAFLVREWQPPEGDEAAEWVLPAAERPLTVRVRGTENDRAELALWVDGRRLTGMPLSWLTGTSSMTGKDNDWRATNVPAGPVAVLAWAESAREEAAAGALDGQATEVGVPWPEVVEVRVVE